MSHHFYGYGQNSGQPPPPGAYPYQQQTSYLPPSFNPPYGASGAPYNANTIESHYNVSQNSYDYNAGRIPGLGISGTSNAPMGSPFSAPPGINPWASSAMLQSPPATGSQNYPAQRNSHGMPTQYGLSSSIPSKPASAKAAPSASSLAKHKPQNQDDLEEGELSEGQFEDLYDSKDSRAPGSVRASPSQPGNKLSSSDDVALQSDLVHPASNAEQVEVDLYGVSEEEGEIAEDNQQMDIDSQRSSSYSPVLTAKEVRNNNKFPTRPEHSTSASLPLPVPSIALAEDATQSSASPTSTNTRQDRELHQSKPSSFRSLLTTYPRTFDLAQKEAKAVVLCLLPLGVKFQDYIDEGFDEKVMKGIFDELHLNVTQTPRADGPSATTLAGIKENSEEKPQKNPQEKSQEKPQVAEPLIDSASSTPEAAAKPEARNERIARLLAAHSKKAATTVKVPKPPAEEPKPNQSSQESSLPTASTKSKGGSDMTLLIQQKMAALKKQKSSQATPSPGPQDAAIAAAPPFEAGMAGGSLGTKAPPTAPASDTQGAHSPSGQAASLGETAAPVNREEDSQRQQVQPGQSRTSPSSPIPGLLPLKTDTPAPNGKKRPVASDFDDYSMTAGPSKRPYHLETQDSTFVIDVSECSDDEDMAMDTDDDTPPGDGPSTQFRHATGGKGLSLGDFPPLTNTKRGHDSGSSTPNVSKNGQKQKTELEVKEESIQRMKEKIAMFEAQAKQKASNKSSSGSQTPRQAAGTPAPDLKDGERDVLPSGSTPTLGSSNPPDSSPGQSTSGALPVLKRFNSSNVARLRNKARAERRGRIVSLDLPRLSQALMEKQERLKNIREEEARLQAEIDSKMAEQNALTEELSQLESEPLEGAVQQDGADSSNTTAEAVVQIDEAPSEVRPSGPPDKPAESPDSVSSGDISMAEDSSDGRYHSQEAEDSQPDSDIDAEARRNRGGSASRGVAHGLERANSSPPLEDSNIASRDESLAPGETQETSPAGTDDPPTHDSGETSGAPPMDESPAAAFPSSPREVSVVELSQGTAGVGAPLAVVDPSSSHADSANQIDDAEQISVVTAPRGSEQELEQGDIGETRDEQASKPDASSFVPYQSPLGYFRAYRFHPEYKASVAGGWKSLTYSGKMSTTFPMCQFELNDEPCTHDADCEFNHFKSMLPADDQIVLELGRPDEFTGEERSRFKQGLRELLQGFRANRVNDFSRIAQAIVEYRAGFLGDRFKVLNLHGVVL